MRSQMVLFVFIIAGMALLNVASATDLQVIDSFSLNDALDSDEDVNCYFITTGSDDHFKYKVVNTGSAGFKLYLIHGHHNETWDGEYYRHFSTDYSVLIFSRSFLVMGEGSEFTIMITTEENNGTSYTIDIDFGSENPAPPIISWVICIGLVVIASCVVIMGVGRVRNQKGHHRYTRNPYSPHQGNIAPNYQHTFWEPPIARMVRSPMDPPPPPDEEPPFAKIVEKDETE